MVIIPKVVGVMSCGVVMCLGLSDAEQAGNAASSADEMKVDQSDRRQGGQAGQKQMGDEREGRWTVVRYSFSEHVKVATPLDIGTDLDRPAGDVAPEVPPAEVHGALEFLNPRGLTPY